MAVFLDAHGVAPRLEYKDIKDRLTSAIQESDVVTIENQTIPYDSSSKKYVITNNDISENHFVSVYYQDSSIVSNCGLKADVIGNTITFTFESEPSGDVICTIIIMKKGGV